MATPEAVAHYQAQAALIPASEPAQARIDRANARRFEQEHICRNGYQVRKTPQPPYDIDTLLRLVRELSARVNELEGNQLDAGDQDSFIVRLPLGDATVPVEYGYSESADDCDGGEVELLGVYVAGHWVDADLFSDYQCECWKEAIETDAADANAEHESNYLRGLGV